MTILYLSTSFHVKRKNILMRGRMLIRMLMMFGPMIMRQFQKFQRQKARQAPVQHREKAPQKYEDVSPEYEEEPIETLRKYKEDDFV